MDALPDDDPRERDWFATTVLFLLQEADAGFGGETLRQSIERAMVHSGVHPNQVETVQRFVDLFNSNRQETIRMVRTYRDDLPPVGPGPGPVAAVMPVRADAMAADSMEADTLSSLSGALPPPRGDGVVIEFGDCRPASVREYL